MCDVTQSKVELDWNDILLIYTDGVTEASSPAGMLSADGLIDLARNLPIDAPAVMAKPFLSMLEGYRRRRPAGRTIKAS